MKNLRALMIVLLALITFSCQRADEPANPVNVFDYLWTKLDQQYTFFDVKQVDWDAVYEVYSLAKASQNL